MRVRFALIAAIALLLRGLSPTTALATSIPEGFVRAYGDIVVPEESLAVGARAAYKDSLWPGGRIYYRFAQESTEVISELGIDGVEFRDGTPSEITLPSSETYDLRTFASAGDYVTVSGTALNDASLSRAYRIAEVFENRLVLVDGQGLANEVVSGTTIFGITNRVNSQRQDAMETAMREWESVAQITFQPESGEAEQVLIENSRSGNWSNVGLIPGPIDNGIWIEHWEDYATLLHELGHTIGLRHEHQRSDRDNYVRIEWSNISDNACDPDDPDACDRQFEIDPLAVIVDAEYDFQSIMHYRQCSWSACFDCEATPNENCRTITVLGDDPDDHQSRMGTYDTVSAGDAEGVRTMYERPGYITVLSPSSGDIWPVGTWQTIAWQFDDPTSTESVEIELSRDNGTNWEPIGPHVGSSNNKSWLVDDPETAQARIRVREPSRPEDAGTSAPFAISTATETAIGAAVQGALANDNTIDTEIAFSPDGEYFAYRITNGVSILDAQSLAEIARLTPGATSAVGFSPNSLRLAWTDGTGSSPDLYVYDVQSREYVVQRSQIWSDTNGEALLWLDDLTIAALEDEGDNRSRIGVWQFNPDWTIRSAFLLDPTDVPDFFDLRSMAAADGYLYASGLPHNTADRPLAGDGTYLYVWDTSTWNGNRIGTSHVQCIHDVLTLGVRPQIPASNLLAAGNADSGCNPESNTLMLPTTNIGSTPIDQATWFHTNNEIRAVAWNATGTLVAAVDNKRNVAVFDSHLNVHTLLQSGQSTAAVYGAAAAWSSRGLIAILGAADDASTITFYAHEDAELPVITVANPRSTGSATISGQVTDNVACSFLTASVDGGAATPIHVGENGNFAHTFTELAEGSHTVQLLAKDVAGNTSVVLTHMTVPCSLPFAPELHAPVDSNSVSESPVTFRWSSLLDATSYDFRIGAACDTGSIYVDTDTSRIVALDPGRYHWSVRGRTECNTTGEWSECRQVSVGDLKPPSPNPAVFEVSPFTPVPDAAVVEMLAGASTDSTPPVLYQFRRAGVEAMTSGWQLDRQFGENTNLPNTRFEYSVRTRDSAPDSNIGAWSIPDTVWTPAMRPGAPQILSTSPYSVTLRLDAGANPSHTELSLYSPSLESGIGPDGRPAGTAIWLPASEWGDVEVVDLLPSTAYRFTSSARNGSHLTTGFGESVLATTAPAEDTIGLYADIGEGVRSAVTLPGAGGTGQFDLVVVANMAHDGHQIEFVLDDPVYLGMPALRLSVTRINNTFLDLGDFQRGEYMMILDSYEPWCEPSGPYEIVRVSYFAIGQFPANTVLGLRGFRAGDSQPSSHGGTMGYEDCSDGLHVLQPAGPRLYTNDGTVVPSGSVVLNPALPVSGVRPTNRTPELVHTSLGQNAPNPFNPRTAITYTLHAAGDVELVVYDLAGRRVKTLVSDHLSAGQHEAQWDGRDEQGRRVASGVYLYRLVAGDFSETKRMVLLK